MQGSRATGERLRRTGALTLVLLGALGLSAAVRAGSTPVSYPDFSSTEGLMLVGDAGTADSLLRLTPDEAGQTGAAWTDEKVVDTKKPFRTEFEYEVASGGIAADGLAFVVQKEGSDAVGGSGHEMGYGGLRQSVEVELDYYPNTDEADPPFEHVGVMTKGRPNNHLKLKDPGFSLVGEGTVWISYTAAKHKLKVAVAEGLDAEKPPPLVKAKVDLHKILGNRAYAGFTSATGGLGASNDVLSWSLQ
jgi:peptide-N4-(N-acetyl-beta-glucosaminyl)asparagine amidase